MTNPFAIALLFLFALATPTRAIDIPITNAGFEDLTLSDGQFTPKHSSRGQYRCPAGPFSHRRATLTMAHGIRQYQISPAEAFEGQNVAYHSVGSFEQTLATDLAPSTEYLLTVQQSPDEHAQTHCRRLVD